jgi:hypothetical protein
VFSKKSTKLRFNLMVAAVGVGRVHTPTQEVFGSAPASGGATQKDATHFVPAKAPPRLSQSASTLHWFFDVSRSSEQATSGAPATKSSAPRARGEVARRAADTAGVPPLANMPRRRIHEGVSGTTPPEVAEPSRTRRGRRRMST